MQNNEEMRELYRSYCRQIAVVQKRLDEARSRDPTPRQKALKGAMDGLLFALVELRRYVPDDEARAIAREAWKDVPDEGVHKR